MFKTIRDLDEILDLLQKGQKVTEIVIKQLCEQLKEILAKEDNVCRLYSPITICGDIHGQFYDLLELFKIGGQLPDTQYIFLGDFVDRGHNSVEVMLYLIALKVRYPDRITLLRGNHESRLTSRNYGFYDECYRKYGSLNVWQNCVDIFDYMPIAATIDKKVFCVHGGLSPSINSIDDISHEINRFVEVPPEGIMSDLLWSDPDESITGWGKSMRGAGYLFGDEVATKFNYHNDTNLVCRAHQLALQGYNYCFDQKLITIWSAPNYMYRCGNVASIMELDEKLNRNLNIFESSSKEQQQVTENTQKVPDYFL